jgi:hypothetical protein
MPSRLGSISGSVGPRRGRVSVPNGDLNIIPRELLAPWYIRRLGRSMELRVLLRHDRRTHFQYEPWTIPLRDQHSSPTQDGGHQSRHAEPTRPPGALLGLARPSLLKNPRDDRRQESTEADLNGHRKSPSLHVRSTVCYPRGRYHVIRPNRRVRETVATRYQNPGLGRLYSYTATENIKSRLPTG